jgi:DNA-binding MarR family transcriptional regulator
MRLTDKQLEVLRVIAEANPDGTLADLDEVIERAAYKPTKQAIQFSIRALIGHELIEKRGAEKRRGRNRVLLAVTPLGQHFHAANRPSISAAVLETEV